MYSIEISIVWNKMFFGNRVSTFQQSRTLLGAIGLMWMARASVIDKCIQVRLELCLFVDLYFNVGLLIKDLHSTK